MKKLLSALMFLSAILMVSCEEEEATEPVQKVAFTFEKDGSKIDYSSNCYWFDHPDNGTPFYIAGWQSDEHNFKITVPKLEVNKWTQADDGQDAKLEFVNYGLIYISSNGDESDYTIEITKYDSKTGRAEGTFSGKVSYFNIYSWEYVYTEITNGVFVVDED